MYNAEVKRKFISSITQSYSRAKYYASIFNRIEKYESELNADMYEMTSDQILNIINDVSTARTETTIVMTRAIRRYLAWCNESGYSHALVDIPVSTCSNLDTIRERCVRSAADLSRRLETIFPSHEAGDNDDVYCCYFWLAFIGIPKRLITDVRVNDVDITNGIISFNGTDYSIPREAMLCFDGCTDYKRLKLKKSDGSLLHVNQSKHTSSQLTSIISSSMKARNEARGTDIKLKYLDVFMSGIYCRMYQNEKNGIPVSFQSVAEEVVESKGEGSNYFKVGRARRQYERDYLIWKEAFGYE